jgi:hypothetical protein
MMEYIMIDQNINKANSADLRARCAHVLASPWRLSRNRIYQIARAFGWKSERTFEHAKDHTRLPGVDEAKIETAVEVILGGTRHKSGKRLLPTETLLEQLRLAGHTDIASVSVSTFNRWLRERNLNHEQLQADNSAIQIRSLYPNHIHFFDASICVQWDLEDGKTVVSRDMQKAFYKNKPGYWKSVRKVLIRWLVVDHYSGAFWVDYTYAGGENTSDLLKVLLDAWGKKPKMEQHYPFHGVPDMVGLDQGAANTSHEAMSLFKKLGIETVVHAAGNVPASVETVQAFWERQFEWELLLEAADNLDDLRARAHDRMIYLNAMKKHGRRRQSRNAKWMEITKKQLRFLPDRS